MIGFFVGQRVKVKPGGNRRDDVDGFVGTVKGICQSGLIVVLDSDPARNFRMYLPTGWEKTRPNVVIRRFFFPCDLEPIPRV